MGWGDPLEKGKDLNHIPYDYTSGGDDRFKGLDMVDRVHEELWKEVCNIVQEAVTKSSRKTRLSKMVEE